MYDTIFINFNVLCDKIIQIESIKKKTINQNNKFEKELKRIQSFFKQHKTFSYDRNKNKNRDHFQNENEKNDCKYGQKKYHDQKRFIESPAMGLNAMISEHQQNAFKKKVKCYNYQKLKYHVKLSMIVLNSIRNNKKISKNNKNVFIIFVLF